MPPPGKSQPPLPIRDSRIDSNAPVPIQDDLRQPSSRSMRVARDVRAEADGAEHEADVARLKAARAADADNIAAMLVRVADTERLRDASELRAMGLEGWTLELEAKLAAARTRADDLETASAAVRRQLDAAQGEVASLRAKVAGLEAEVSKARRDGDDAVELERVKRGLEVDALVGQHSAALAAARGDSSVSALGAVREVMSKVTAALDELDRHDSESGVARARLLEQARRALNSDHITAPPPPPEPSRVAAGATMPPPPRPARKKSRRPSAPPAPPPPSATPITKPGDQLETFADLLDLTD